MTRKEAVRINEQEARLLTIGFTMAEAESLRRISMTLHRWFELECGDSDNYKSWAIERDEETEVPYLVVHPHDSNKVHRHRIADRERGAERRLQAIVDARNARNPPYTGGADCAYVDHRVTRYIQSDPRGVALYILRPGDVPEGGDVMAYYNRGICVY